MLFINRNSFAAVLRSGVGRKVAKESSTIFVYNLHGGNAIIRIVGVGTDGVAGTDGVTITYRSREREGRVFVPKHREFLLPVGDYVFSCTVVTASYNFVRLRVDVPDHIVVRNMDDAGGEAARS